MKFSDFKTRIPNFSNLAKVPSKLVPYFALYLELEDSEAAVSSGAVNGLFEDARVNCPANTSDIIRKSKSFVRTKAGHRLAHDARDRMMAELSLAHAVDQDIEGHSRSVPESEETSSVSRRDVFVVYGRDERLWGDLFSLLRALGLNPLEFGEMANLTGSTSPTTLEVIRMGFKKTQACVVLFSPDENVSLREDLRSSEDPEDGKQPRPNVFIEAGMALALYPERTILVKVGDVRDVSDLSGLQYVKLTKDPGSRNRLVSKLKTAGCAVTTNGDHWLKVGNFAADDIGR